MNGRILFLLVISLFLAVPFALADSEKSGNTHLLAVIEKGGNKTGAIANLDLDIKQGSGRVFLDTFPLTKISTQVSMRFAQQIACSELDLDCSGYDFFYTINALPGIVGGPSAGAAAAVLAASLLLDLEIRQDSAVSGTINSGGIIGAVGGLKGKIEAASKNGVRLVVIPKGTRVYNENKDEETNSQDAVVISAKENMTIDLVEYGKKLNITVVEAATLVEAIKHMTGYEVKRIEEPFVIDEEYKKTMKAVSKDLCSRNQDIHKQVITQRLSAGIANPDDTEEEALNYSSLGQDTFDAEEYYSSASYCFRSNVALKKVLYSYTDYSEDEINRSLKIVEAKVSDFEISIEAKNITTITALQTVMAVNERIDDTKKIVLEAYKEKNLSQKSSLLAYAEERLYSARAWAKFFDNGDELFELDNGRLKMSCQSKLDEAEERYGYLLNTIPGILGEMRDEIDEGYALLEKKKYITCLYKAIRSKAEIDVVLGLMGVQEDNLPELIDLKLDIVQQALVRSQKKGIFPIIGYSYYEYGRSLKENDKYSSLLFSGYALEFSNLDIYFPKKEKPLSRLYDALDKKVIFAFAIGLTLGILLMQSRRYCKTLQTPRKRRLRGKKR